MKRTIIDLYSKLYSYHIESDNKNWQSIKIADNNPLVEITNVFVNLGSSNDLIKDTDPNLPWAMDHFEERVNGFPINPGKEYRNWPFYEAKDLDNDRLFRSKGKFSHNYMERYWCSDLKGRRYQYGDLHDVMDRLRKNPNTRQAYLSVWHPEDQSNNDVRVPCTLGYWFYKENGKINITYHIRSCDAVRHLRNDIYMTYRLLQFVCQDILEEPGNMYMWIGSLHCFKSDLYYINKYVRDTDN
jgi:thymidylate synthase